MPKFKTSFTCDVCGQKITYPNFRIEWGHTKKHSFENSSKFDFIQVCHEDCSYGIRTISSYPRTYGDIIYDQLPYSAELTNTRLNELSQTNPILSEQIQSIKNNIFE